MARRVQTFTVTVEMPTKDACGMYTQNITEGIIRRALYDHAAFDCAEVNVSEGKEVIRES